jgi:hypothetical protein
MDSSELERRLALPLSYGYIYGSDVHFNVHFDYMKDFYTSARIGASLVDFPWIEPLLADFIFTAVYDRYINLLFAPITADQIAAELLNFSKEYLRINIYFTIYLLGFINYLLNSRLDGRMISDGALDYFNRNEKLVFHEDGSIPLQEKDVYITLFLHSMKERQALVEQTLSKVLHDENKTPQDSLARFYEYESNDALFREHWHSRFETFFGIRSEDQAEVVQLYSLSGIDDMMRYELVQMLVRGVAYKRCQCCEKLFIPSGRADSLYCHRVLLGQKKPCNQIGANLVAKKKVETSPALRLYRQAYHRLSKRVEYGYMSPEAFEEWKAEALPKREQCVNGELSLEDFTLWINKTSRQRQEERP